MADTNTIKFRDPNTGLSVPFSILGDTPTEQDYNNFLKLIQTDQYKAWAAEQQKAPEVAAQAPAAPASPTSNPLDFLVPENAGKDTPPASRAAPRITPPTQDTLNIASDGSSPPTEPTPASLVGVDASPDQPTLPTDPEAALVEGAAADTPVARQTPPAPPAITAAQDTVPDAQKTTFRYGPQPVPTTEFFANLNDNRFLTVEEKQQIIDEQYARWRGSEGYHPGVIQQFTQGKDWIDTPFGRESYNGIRIPKFMVDEDGSVYVENVAMYEGMEDGVKYLAILAGDGIDYVRSGLGEEVNNSNSVGQWLDDNFTEYKETRTGRGILKEVGGMLVGGGVAKNAVGWTTNVIKGWPKLMASVRGGAIGAGTTLSMDPDASGLFVGTDALFKYPQEHIPLLKGLNPDASAEEYEQRMQNRFALLMEGATLGFVAEGAVKTTAAAGRLAFGMTVGNLMSVLGIGQRTTRDQAVVREITDRLIAAENASGPQREQFVRDLAESLRANSEIILSMDNALFGEITANQSTMNAFLLAVEKGDMTALANTMDVAKRLQQGQLTKGGATARVVEETGTAANRMFENAQTTLGGAEGVADATTKIQNDTLASFAEDTAKVTDAAANLRAAEGALAKAMADDPVLGQALKGIQTRTGIDLVADNGALMDNIASRVKDAYVALKGQRREIYGKIVGGTLDTEGLVAQLRSMEPETLSLAADALPDGPMKAMMRMVAERPKTKMVDGKRVAKTADEIAKDEAAILGNLERQLELVGVTDYGSFYREIRPAIAQVKDSLYTARQGGNVRAGGAAETFQNFMDFIDGDLLDSTQSAELIETVGNAIKWDKENFVPYFRGDGPLADIARTYDTQIAGRGGEGVKDTADWYTFNNMATNAVADNLGQRNRAYAEQIVTLLKRPEAGGKIDDVYSWIVNETLTPLNVALKQGAEPSAEVVQNAMNSLSMYATVLRREFPEQADRIRILQDDILTGKQNIRNLEGILEAAKANAAEVEELMFKGQLQDFFEKQGIPKGWKSRENPQGIWDTLINNFNSPQDAGRFRMLAEDIHATNDPVLIRGMQSAYLNRMQSNFFVPKQTSNGSRIMSEAKLLKEADSGRFAEGLRMVFKDKPEIAETMMGVLERAGIVQGNATRSGLTLNSLTAFTQQRVRDLNSVVTVLLGPLSRTGAKARAIGTKLINKAAGPEAYEDAVDKLLADPKAFADVLETIIARDYKQPSDLKEVAVAAFVRAGFFEADREEEFLSMDPATFNALVQSETMLREGAEQVQQGWRGTLDEMENWARSWFR